MWYLSMLLLIVQQAYGVSTGCSQSDSTQILVSRSKLYSEPEPFWCIKRSLENVEQMTSVSTCSENLHNSCEEQSQLDNSAHSMEQCSSNEKTRLGHGEATNANVEDKNNKENARLCVQLAKHCEQHGETHTSCQSFMERCEKVENQTSTKSEHAEPSGQILGIYLIAFILLYAFLESGQKPRNYRRKRRN